MKLEDVHGGSVGERRGCYAREKVVSKAIKCSWACGSLEQSTMSLVGSQAGVLCEMTTRAALADETPPPPKAPSPRRDVNQAAAAAWWGSICLHSHFLDDTATHHPRHTPGRLVSISPGTAFLLCIRTATNFWPHLILVSNNHVFAQYISTLNRRNLPLPHCNRLLHAYRNVGAVSRVYIP